MNNSKIRLFDTVCRTCMGDQETDVVTTATRQTTKSLISIYEEHETMNFGYNNIVMLLKQTSPRLTVETDDMLPKNICGSCLDMLIKINEFQEESLRVERRLRDIIEQYDPLQDIDADPLSNNKVQLVKVEIDAPIADVTKPARGFFTLTPKDGDFVEVYSELDKHDVYESGCSEKSDNDDDVGCSEKSDNDDVVGCKSKTQFDDNAASEANDMKRFWLYFDGNNEEKYSTMKEQNRKNLVDDEVNSTKVQHERTRKRLDKTTRKSNRDIRKAKEIPDGSNNLKQKCEDEDVDSECLPSSTLAISNDMKNGAVDESHETRQSGSNKISEDDDSEWETTLDTSKSHLDANQQDNLKPRDEAFRGYSCSECRKRLKTRRGLERHLKRHIENKQKPKSEENDHICPECGKRLKSRRILRRHILRHGKLEQKIKKRPYLCSKCGKSFPTPSSLHHHAETHSTDLKYQCPGCPKRFRCKTNMAAHKALVHTTVRPHVCDVCGSSFKKHYLLSKHKINHGEKKHKCDFCEKKFSHPDQCRRHMRTHTGEKPHKCKYCDKSYTQRSEVMTHLRVHLGTNIYRCEMCPQAFRMMCELRAHFASHKDDDEETKLQNIKALKEEEKRIHAKIESEKQL